MSKTICGTTTDADFERAQLINYARVGGYFMAAQMRSIFIPAGAAVSERC
jgi:hypothetical protein